jgi:hypothetical protein
VISRVINLFCDAAARCRCVAAPAFRIIAIWTVCIAGRSGESVMPVAGAHATYRVPNTLGDTWCHPSADTGAAVLCLAVRLNALRRETKRTVKLYRGTALRH